MCIRDRRYVAYGVTSTLITLVVGIIFISIFEFFFRNIRHRMTREIEEENSGGVVTGLAWTEFGGEILKLTHIRGHGAAKTGCPVVLNLNEKNHKRGRCDKSGLILGISLLTR